MENFKYKRCKQIQNGDLQIFLHHIYEYEKGVRNLILHTLPGNFKEFVISKLEDKGIAYTIHQLKNGSINVYFGADLCIETIDSIGKKNLTEYSREEDFILGIMLGYDRMRQCERYIKRNKI